MKTGDKVIMNANYYVMQQNKGKVWTVASDPWTVCGSEVVKLEGRSGCYSVDGLNIVERDT